MKIFDSINNLGSKEYFNPKILKVFEDHIDYLLRSENTRIDTIAVEHQDKFKYNFSRLLIRLGHPIYLHPIIMRLNGYTGDSEFVNAERLIVPGMEDILRILNIASGMLAKR